MRDSRFRRFDPRSEKERNYDRINNEGGSGYNPYRAKRLEQEAIDARKQYEEDMKRPTFEREEITRKLAYMDWNDPMNKEKVSSLRARAAELDQIIKEDKFKKLTEAGWTPEATAQRREAWNAAIEAGEITGRNGKVDMAKLVALRKRMGFSENQLREAIEFYKEYNPPSRTTQPEPSKTTEEPKSESKSEPESKPATEKSALQLPAPNVQRIQSQRTKQSQNQDALKAHSVIVSPDSPKVRQWIRNQGSMDILGVDTPPNIKHVTVKIKPPKLPKPPRLKRAKTNAKISKAGKHYVAMLNNDRQKK